MASTFWPSSTSATPSVLWSEASSFESFGKNLVGGNTGYQVLVSARPLRAHRRYRQGAQVTQSSWKARCMGLRRALASIDARRARAFDPTLLLEAVAPPRPALLQAAAPDHSRESTRGTSSSASRERDGITRQYYEGISVSNLDVESPVNLTSRVQPIAAGERERRRQACVDSAKQAPNSNEARSRERNDCATRLPQAKLATGLHER